MNEIRIPMDPYNPGHFYACCGLLELIARQAPTVESRFDLSGPIRKGQFCFRTTDRVEITQPLAELQGADVEFEGEVETAVKIVRVKLPGEDLVLDWWLDYFRDKTRNLKCWAGQVTTEKLMDELRSSLSVESTAEQLFFEGRMMKTKFGIDPRSAWSALDVGFSPNEHNKDAITYPAVELLGAIGLQGFRPQNPKRDEVPFYLWKTWLGRVPARRAAIAPWSGLDVMSMQFKIGKRGQSYKYFKFAEQRETDAR